MRSLRSCRAVFVDTGPDFGPCGLKERFRPPLRALLVEMGPVMSVEAVHNTGRHQFCAEGGGNSVRVADICSGERNERQDHTFSLRKLLHEIDCPGHVAVNHLRMDRLNVSNGTKLV